MTTTAHTCINATVGGNVVQYSGLCLGDSRWYRYARYEDLEYEKQARNAAMSNCNGSPRLREELCYYSSGSAVVLGKFIYENTDNSYITQIFYIPIL